MNERFRANSGLVLMVVGVLVVAGVGLSVHDWRSDEEQINVLLARAKKGVETRHIAKCLSVFSNDYEDSEGMTYRDVQRGLFAVLRESDHLIQIDYQRMDVDVSRREAHVALHVVVVQKHADKKRTMGPFDLRIMLRREWVGWRVHSVEGWVRPMAQMEWW